MLVCYAVVQCKVEPLLVGMFMGQKCGRGPATLVGAMGWTEQREVGALLTYNWTTRR